jgi:exonuclease VII small subunit
VVDDEDFQALEQRVTALESQQGTDHRLAVSLDRDVAAVQAQRHADRRLLQALRETQIEDHERILRLEQGQARLEQGQARLEQGQARLEQGQARLEQRQAQLEDGQAATTVSLGTIIRMLERLQPGE